MFWALFTLFLLLIVYGIGKGLNKNLTGDVLVGLIIGLVWEIVTGRLWLYDIKKLIVFYVLGNEIPIAVIFAWGTVLMSSSLLTWLLQKKLFKKMDDVTYFIGGLISILLVCIPSETFGYNIGLWTYYFTGYIVPLINLPLYVVGAWFFFGIVFLATIKVYEDEIEKRIQLKLS